MTVRSTPDHPGCCAGVFPDAFFPKAENWRPWLTTCPLTGPRQGGQWPRRGNFFCPISQDTGFRCVFPAQLRSGPRRCAPWPRPPRHPGHLQTGANDRMHECTWPGQSPLRHGVPCSGIPCPRGACPCHLQTAANDRMHEPRWQGVSPLRYRVPE